jgi:GH43 family beta-xylosidase
MILYMKKLIGGLLLLLLCFPVALKAQSKMFSNPVLPSGADPWVTYHQGYYYYMHTLGNRLKIWKTKSVAGLNDAESKDVWFPPAKGPNSRSVWAPELHFIQGKWYIYYTAADDQYNDDAHRYVFVLENASPDPLQGEWIAKGKLNTNFSGLDGSVFEHRKMMYFIYSAYVDHQSTLIISAMENPWTLKGEQIQIARPTFNWEKFGGREILEGPQFLKGRKGQLFIIYSASACWDDNYALGMLEANSSSNLLDSLSWKKSPVAVFKQAPENGVYAPGHNSFFKSPDGKEDWILYHANAAPGQGCDHRRSPRMQQFKWKKDGSPDFGNPVKAGKSMPVPAEN